MTHLCSTSFFSFFLFFLLPPSSFVWRALSVTVILQHLCPLLSLFLYSSHLPRFSSSITPSLSFSSSLVSYSGGRSRLIAFYMLRTQTSILSLRSPHSAHTHTHGHAHEQKDTSVRSSIEAHAHRMHTQTSPLLFSFSSSALFSPSLILSLSCSFTAQEASVEDTAN